MSHHQWDTICQEIWYGVYDAITDVHYGFRQHAAALSLDNDSKVYLLRRNVLCFRHQSHQVFHLMIVRTVSAWAFGQKLPHFANLHMPRTVVNRERSPKVSWKYHIERFLASIIHTSLSGSKCSSNRQINFFGSRSQSDLKASFTKESDHQIYPAVTPNNPAITTKGKIVVIAGWSKGIDYAIANAFGIANASKIVLLTRTKETLKEAQTLLKSIFVNTVFCYCSVDITNRKIMADVFESIRDKVGEPNVLVLSAAYLHPLKAGLDISDEDLDRSFDVNFKANINLVRIFFDSRTQYSETKILINVSAVAAHTQQPNMSAYGASKAAFVHWLDHAQAEHLGMMRIHHMHPGIIRTDLLRDRGSGVGGWDWKNGKSRFSDIWLWLWLNVY